MCYDIHQQLLAQLKEAEYYRDHATAMRLREELGRLNGPVPEFYHASGFAHPQLIVFRGADLGDPLLAKWGLVPAWTKDEQATKKLMRMTLNARFESIFDKPAFRASAMAKRCVVWIQGFFEHQHRQGLKVPHYISRADGRPMLVAGLWSEWVDKSTAEIIHSFSIVTTKANGRMAEIHNNPKLPEPRMPFILDEQTEQDWLRIVDQDKGREQERLKGLLQPFDDELYQIHSVRPLRGRAYLGNVPEVIEAYRQEDTLF